MAAICVDANMKINQVVAASTLSRWVWLKLQSFCDIFSQMKFLCFRWTRRHVVNAFYLNLSFAYWINLAPLREEKKKRKEDASSKEMLKSAAKKSINLFVFRHVKCNLFAYEFSAASVHIAWHWWASAIEQRWRQNEKFAGNRFHYYYFQTHLILFLSENFYLSVSYRALPRTIELHIVISIHKSTLHKAAAIDVTKYHNRSVCKPNKMN